MAVLPGPGNYSINNLDREVVIIEEPGHPEERVLLRYDASNSRVYPLLYEKVEELPMLDRNQKSKIYFWMGYFYAHLCGRVKS